MWSFEYSEFFMLNLRSVLTVVINAWVRSGEMQQAEQILDYMEKSYYKGKGKIVPNVVSYTTVMNG